MKKSQTLVLALLILVFGIQFSKAQCPVPNGGFQNWSTEDAPDDWYGSFLLKIPGRTGGFAVQLDTFSMFPVPGILGTVFPCTTRSNYLNGYLKADFSQSPNDSIVFIIYQKLAGQDVPGAIGTCRTSTSRTNWTPFHIPISSVAAGAVDSVSISIIRFGNGKATIAFDDISLSNTALGQPVGNCQVITGNLPKIAGRETTRIYPNPVFSELSIQSDSPVSEISVFDGLGKLVIREEFPRGPISVAGLQKGFYVSRIKTSGQTVYRRFLKE